MNSSKRRGLTPRFFQLRRTSDEVYRCLPLAVVVVVLVGTLRRWLPTRRHVSGGGGGGGPGHPQHPSHVVDVDGRCFLGDSMSPGCYPLRVGNIRETRPTSTMAAMAGEVQKLEKQALRDFRELTDSESLSSGKALCYRLRVGSIWEAWPPWPAPWPPPAWPPGPETYLM